MAWKCVTVLHSQTVIVTVLHSQTVSVTVLHNQTGQQWLGSVLLCYIARLSLLLCYIARLDNSGLEVCSPALSFALTVYHSTGVGSTWLPSSDFMWQDPSVKIQNKPKHPKTIQVLKSGVVIVS